MKAFIALIRREYLEYRGAFVIAPLVITALILGLTLLAHLAGHREGGFAGMIDGPITIPLKMFEVGFFGGSALWFAYLMVALFFYFANAFSADSRNNSMLFWKSMPQSDLRILTSKLAAGMTLFPAMLFGFMLLMGVFAFVQTALAPLLIPQFTAPSAGEMLMAFGNIAVILAGMLVLSMAWFMPFFAWVGGLSTLVGRWCIPLAFLVPGLLAVVEKLLLWQSGPRTGYIANYLRERLHMVDERMFALNFIDPHPINALDFLGKVVTQIDWVGMGTGWVFTALVIYAASEWRRRGIER